MTRRSTLLLLAGAAWSSLLACGETAAPSEPLIDEAATISIAFKLTAAAAADIARAELVISAEDMADIRQHLSIVDEVVRGTVRGIRAGPDRLFTLNGYDAGDDLIYTGATSASVVAGQQVPVRITLYRYSGGSTTNVVLSIVSPVFCYIQNTAVLRLNYLFPANTRAELITAGVPVS